MTKSLIRRTSLIILSLLFLLLLSGCTGRLSTQERAQIYEEKGYNEMRAKKKRLKPEIINYSKQFYELAEVSIENSIATIDGSGSFALMQFDERGKIKVKPIVKGFPGGPGLLGGDSEHNVLWLVRGRGVYFLDIESKKTGHVVVTNDGNSRIRQVVLLDPEKKLFMITSACVGCAMIFHTYDLLNDKLTKLGADNAAVFRFHDKKIIGYYYGKEDNGRPYFEWDISDYEIKKFEGPDSNKLTKELTKLEVDIWHKTKTIHLGKRMMLGTSWINDELIYYSVRWNEELDEVKVEPIIIQQPSNSTIHSDFVFSADGNWVKTIYDLDDSKPKLTELIIYHTSSLYPQGLSMPIYCGYTKEGNEGAFMQHAQWGPVYVERDQDMTEKLFIYKLNDGLEILKEQAVFFNTER